MSSSTAENPCAPNDKLCIIKEHDLAVIIVPTLLLAFTVVTLVALFSLKYCRERKRTHVTHKHRSVTSRHKSNRQGIDAPPGINPLEHEELPMSVHVQQNAESTWAAVPQRSTERHHEAFSQLTALPPSIFRFNHSVSLYRARMNNRDVVLRVLKETANNNEKQQFLGFASFVSGLGPHPFLPALLGVVSVQPPLMMVVEELWHRDLLQFLWRCRQDSSNSESSCDMTEKRLFTMATQVASALNYLHSQRCIHGNLGARSVLVGEDLTAKLWGLESAYQMKTQASSVGGVDDMLIKWQAPEVLVRRETSQSSDVWSFGILLYEMVTLGDPPFAQIKANELLQYLQRGKHLKRPATCSNSVYSIIKSCCHWNPHQRISVAELIKKLQAGEKSANGRTVFRVSEPIDIEKYTREAGYRENYDFAVL